MNPTKTLKLMKELWGFDKYDALHHLFAVNGCGYDWVKGELHYMTEAAQRKEHAEYLDGLVTEKQQMCRELGRTIKTREEILKERESWLLSRPDVKLLYPLSEYSNICCIPDDITNAWFKKAKLAIEVFLVYYEKTHADTEALTKAYRRIDEIKRARQIPEDD